MRGKYNLFSNKIMSKRIKIIHILNTSEYSGAENVAISIIKGTREYCDSIYVSLDGGIRKVLKENCVQFFPVNKINILNLKRAIKILKPDIIHAHDFTTSIIAIMTLTKIPIISHIHNNSPWIKKIGIKSVVYGLSCFRYIYILTVSNSVMDEYIFGRFFKRKTNIIGNPIDIYSILEKATNNRMKEVYGIAFLGRFSLEKNPHRFVDIVSKVLYYKPKMKACMIGDGELKEEIRIKIHNMGLDNVITLYGFQKNPYSIVNNTKVLCMPSRWEGFGLAAVEALALGKPVICSNVGGLKKIIDNTCGKLCCTMNEYVNEITTLLSDEEYYNLKSEGARKKALSLNNMISYCDKVKQIYEQCIY